MESVPHFLCEVVVPESLKKTVEIVSKLKECDENTDKVKKWFNEQEFKEWEEFFICECLNKFIKIRAKGKEVAQSFISKHQHLSERIEFEDVEAPDSPLIDIIKKDDIDELQKLSAINDFDFNMSFSFIGIGESLTLLDCCALYGSIKCFRYVLLNGAKAGSIGCMNAVRGGNLEIVRICSLDATNMDLVMCGAVEYHRDDVFDWIQSRYSTNPQFSLSFCIEHVNIICSLFFIDNGCDLNDDICGITSLMESVYICNLPLAEHLLMKGSMPFMSIKDNKETELSIARKKKCKDLMILFDFQK